MTIGGSMYFNNIKKLRNEKELTQEQISKELNVNRSSYNNWERGIVMIPLDIADKLSLYYSVSLSCVLGIDKDIKYDKNIKKINYGMLLKNIKLLKEKNKNTYDEIGEYLKCTGATCQRYFKGIIKIPIDRLILLSEFYNVNLDKMCDKK